MITVTKEDLIRTIISVKNGRGVFPNDCHTIDDYQKLMAVSSNNCSEKTMGVFIEFFLNFGELYHKGYPELIEQLRKFEEEKSNSEHRDHVCHSFWVWCLGYWFYQNGLEHFFSSINHTNDNFHFIWYLTAFYHDIGYVKKHDYHGGDSAQILLERLNDRFSGNWTANAIHAIVAICLHDKKEPIDFLKDPFSALLVICDEIQEWGRTIGENKKRCEIDKLQICLDFESLSPAMMIELFYPRDQTVFLKKLNEFTNDKEKKLKKNLGRIKKIVIKAKCTPYNRIP